MTRQTDLEHSIRESYAIIREYEAILRTSDRPEEKARARRLIGEQWALVQGALAERRQIGDPLPADLAQLEARVRALEELGKVEQVIEAQEQSRGILPDDQLAAMLKPWQDKRQSLHAQLWGDGGTVAQGGSAVATGNGIAVAGNVGNINVHYHGRDETAEAERARQRYLLQLRRFCNVLPLAALGGEEGADQDVTLDQVYIALDTRTPVPLSDEERKARSNQFALGERDETSPLTALEAATRHSGLVLLGDPGGGKSTFVRQIVGWCAAAQLGQRDAPPADLGALLPVLVSLRDLVPRLRALDLQALPAEQQQAALAQALRDQCLADLKRLDADAFSDGLADALVSGHVLLVLDGLDEVPPALRLCVRQVVQAIMVYYAPTRVIVTCRVRSYVGDAVLPAFEAHTLAPFDEDKIGAFVSAWYHTQRELGRVDTVQEKLKRDDLTRAACSADLFELAANPMLLTTMAIIHQREIGLPKERVRLYDLAVDVLLNRWQKRKAGQGGDMSPELGALLGSDRKLREVMERLAYETHRQERANQDQSGDLARGAALTLLESPLYLGDVGLAGQFLDYVDHRAGLLSGQGAAEGHPGVYAFPHRTFQEYLAGCYVIGLRDAHREVWQRVREGDAWQLAVLLGAEELLYNRRNPNGLLDLAYRLCPEAEPSGAAGWRAALWSGQMAALLDRTTIEADCDVPGCGPDYLARLIPRLVRVLESGVLTPLERAEAGNALARLGDPRPGVGVISLPLHTGEGSGMGVVPDLVWCEVPGGPFLMGDDNHSVSLPAFLISRYPITQAQFAAFVGAGGYADPRYWPEAEKAGWWQKGQFKGLYDSDPRSKPNEYGAPFNLLNHPVVGVSWYEALAFCRWLEERLKTANGELHDAQGNVLAICHSQCAIRLPSEAEWEKAASWDVGANPGGRPHKRRYPWGDEPDPDKANYDQTGIGTTSAVGCFPGGASPYGVLDLSGNVWEWCSSLYKSYPYRADDGREDVSANRGRVLRGGAFDGGHDLVRCACRSGVDPGDGGDDYGFRVVVVSPSFPSGL